ncbi:MAG: Lrp/AsnC family transcriptional regulator [Parvibaculales bacterium]
MSAKKSLYDFSELDLRIIDMLREDGRASNQRIADALGVSTSVVATRIKRMENADAMKIVAVSDFTALNYNILLPIGVSVKNRCVEQTAEDLAAYEEVVSVQTCTGRHEIRLLVALEDISSLENMLLNKLSMVEGVHSLDPSTAVDILKFKFDVAPA